MQFHSIASSVLILSLVLLNFTESYAKRHLKKAKNKSCKKKGKKSNFCKGVSYPLFGGGCSDPINICDDMDETTADSCDKSTEVCSHTMIDPSDPTCLQTCEPDCDGKDCGENGCGKF
jgi:hypothetical protein